jgi:polygalacturonase
MSSLTDAKKWAKEGDDYIPWIQGSSCSGLTIHGGAFEGHNSFWDFLKNKKQDNPRPYMMKFSDVTDFKAHNITLKNSPHTHFKIAGGKNVEIWNMHLETKMATENTDGIMLANVQKGHVHEVWIQNGDDCLKANDNSHNVVFENGTCIGGHGLSIGGGGSSLGIQDIMFRNFELQDMSNGARIKFTSKTSGFVNNVTYQNLTMKHVKHPLYITTGYQSTQASLSSTTSSTRLKLEDINYIDITATDDKAIGGSGGSIASPGDFECDSTAPCKDLHLRKVTMTTKKKWIGKSAGGDESSVLPDASSLFKPSLARSSSSVAFV